MLLLLSLSFFHHPLRRFRSFSLTFCSPKGWTSLVTKLHSKNLEYLMLSWTCLLFGQLLLWESWKGRQSSCISSQKNDPRALWRHIVWIMFLYISCYIHTIGCQLVAYSSPTYISFFTCTYYIYSTVPSQLCWYNVQANYLVSINICWFTQKDLQVATISKPSLSILNVHCMHNLMD